MTRRKLIAGNWKMHGSNATLSELDMVAAAARGLDVDVAVFPPFTLIAAAAARETGLIVGAQDCHVALAGAHTGCVAAPMLVEAGAKMCIVGHSERRQDQRETDSIVRAKGMAVQAAGMTPIVCVGETLEERDAGRAVTVVEAQLTGSLPDDRSALVVAYEPVWAIGTGRTPTTADVAQMHAAIRAIVGREVRILYGGSVKAANASALLHVANVDGALVGGASLTAADFVPIVLAAVEPAAARG